MLATWQDALDYLYGRANWETRPPGSRPGFELDRIREVLAAMGDPHLRWPAVHVGGTNGKGSTCAMVDAALRQAGYRVGLYTSPHLHTVRERVRVDGRPIGERDVLTWLNEHRSGLDRHRGLTTFEALTALAFSTFAAADVDIAVVEVGLGGTLDTTNVVSPAVTVLTPIALDHTSVLGDTVGQIARDKCGIIRPGVPVVSAPQEPAAHEVIERTIAFCTAPWTRVGLEVRWEAAAGRGRHQPEELIVTAGDPPERYRLRLGLAGSYQRVNAATAVGALRVLAERGWRITPEHVAAGLARAEWPARFECLGRQPAMAPGEESWPQLVVDSAHNPHGLDALLAALDDRFPGARRHWIVGFSLDKPIEELLGLLMDRSASVIAAAAPHPRAVPAPELAHRIARLGGRAFTAASPPAALDEALRRAEPGDLVVATGSVFLAAGVREAWLHRSGGAMPPRDPPPPMAASPPTAS